MSSIDDDRDRMNETVEAIRVAIATTLDRAWHLSPRGTLLATSRALAVLALDHVRAHPEARDSVLTTLRSIAECVECETATRQ